MTPWLKWPFGHSAGQNGASNHKTNGVPPYLKGLSSRRRRNLTDIQQVWHRVSLEILSVERLEPPWAVGVCSAVRGEGRSTAATALAVALARETRDRVALLEIDVENPVLASAMGAEQSPGLLDYMRGECTVEDVLRPTDMGNLTFIPVGAAYHARIDDPEQDDAMFQLRRGICGSLEEFKRLFAFIVVDCPPVLSNVNADVVAEDLDGILFLVRAGGTPVSKVREAIALLDEDKLLGVVHIGMPSAIPRWLSGLVSG
jgi:Mrp family chromosome partitioning ATPase